MHGVALHESDSEFPARPRRSFRCLRGDPGDTGYRPHVDLAANILPGYDFISTTDISNDGEGRHPDASDPGDAVVAATAN